MDLSMWLVLLYGVVALIALRALLALMDQHRRLYWHELKLKATQEAEKQNAAQTMQAQESESEPEQRSREAA